MGVSRKGRLLALSQNSQNMNTFLHNSMNFGGCMEVNQKGLKQLKTN